MLLLIQTVNIGDSSCLDDLPYGLEGQMSLEVYRGHSLETTVSQKWKMARALNLL